MNLTPPQIKPNQPKALMLARRELSVLVHDAVLLEGIHFTLPEIQTLLEGITVGGHTLSDQQIATNQGRAWRQLFSDLEAGAFALSRPYACHLHALAAEQEALEWGRFRSGGVTIAGTDYMPPTAAQLPELFDEMVATATAMEDVYQRATFVFLTMARCQFFYDVNKRMGRFLMNGILLSHGYPVINVPAKRKLEFNQLMLAFYASNEMRDMQAFLLSCLDPRVVVIMGE